MASQIEHHKFPRNESCTEEGCRARKYYIEDGKKFCQRGHEQIGFTQTQQDEDDWSNQGRKTRKKREHIERAQRILRGRDAVSLYLECYQLILWKQCHWLVHTKRFPPELEVVVRDLWSLRGSDLLKYGESKSDFGSDTATMVFSSQSEGEGTDTDGTDGRSISSRRSRRSVQSSEKLPRLIETLGLCYLGTLLMRLPSSLGDFYKWAMHGEIIYMRAIQEIPNEMRSRLPAHYHSAFEIRAPLRGFNLHRAVLDLVSYFNSNFEMAFPPLNFPLLLFKHIRDLGLPVEIYPASQQIAELLDLNFLYLTLHSRTLEALAYPEIRLISMIIVAVKLSHPFDDIERRPETDSDPTILKIDWERWRNIMTERPSKPLKKGEELNITDTDVFNMSSEQMDEYLEWYQRTWIDDREPKMAEKALSFFPLPELPPKESKEFKKDNITPDLLKRVQRSLVLQRSLSKDDEGVQNIKQPGELYRRYRNVEDLPASAKSFFELAAENVGTSLEMLVRAVFQLEVRLEQWGIEEKKRGLRDERS
ncbi:hypothetical protein BGZ60DRAFT_414514 [Tricladium varicosporioides]|nr:hypothetical protein BGZ60DRAFT_414514 [Hymenoscyphus varicosporioides]